MATTKHVSQIVIREYLPPITDNCSPDVCLLKLATLAKHCGLTDDQAISICRDFVDVINLQLKAIWEVIDSYRNGALKPREGQELIKKLRHTLATANHELLEQHLIQLKDNFCSDQLDTDPSQSIKPDTQNPMDIYDVRRNKEDAAANNGVCPDQKFVDKINLPRELPLQIDDISGLAQLPVLYHFNEISTAHKAVAATSNNHSALFTIRDLQAHISKDSSAGSGEFIDSEEVSERHDAFFHDLDRDEVRWVEISARIDYENHQGIRSIDRLIKVDRWHPTHEGGSFLAECDGNYGPSLRGFTFARVSRFYDTTTGESGTDFGEYVDRVWGASLSSSIHLLKWKISDVAVILYYIAYCDGAVRKAEKEVIYRHFAHWSGDDRWCTEYEATKADVLRSDYKKRDFWVSTNFIAEQENYPINTRDIWFAALDIVMTQKKKWNGIDALDYLRRKWRLKDLPKVSA